MSGHLHFTSRGVTGSLIRIQMTRRMSQECQARNQRIFVCKIEGIYD